MPASNSDLSGVPLEGSNDPIAIRIRFPDGNQRDLTVSAAEAKDLERKGSAVSRRGIGRFAASVRNNGWKLALYVGAGIFTGLLIPAVVEQWADRQKELELKNTLVTGISDLASETTANAILIYGDATPEARARLRAQADFDAAQTPEETKEARIALKAAAEAEFKAEQTLFNQQVNAVIKNGSGYEARLQTYFSDTSLSDAWAAAREVVREHLALVTDRTDEERGAMEGRIFDYLCEGSASGPKQASEEVKAACDAHVNGATPHGRKFPYVATGNELLRLLRVRLLSGIRDANAEGYSTGFMDLFWSVLPG